MKKNDLFLILGIVWFILLGVFYTIKIGVDEGSNYVIQDSILGIIIFHSFWILLLYIFIGATLIFFGFNKKKK